MSRPMPSWNEPSQSRPPSEVAAVPAAAASSLRGRRALSPNGGRIGTPVAAVQKLVRTRAGGGASREVLVTVPGAPLGCRVYLESQPLSGPSERVRAFELPSPAAEGKREFRALLAPIAPGSGGFYAPVVVFDGQELTGERFRAESESALESKSAAPASAVTASDRERHAVSASLPFPAMELIAQVESDLPAVTVFGPTPEGLRISFYISDGYWAGPRIHAQYKSEGGDWIVVRRDGIAVPNARATLQTSDGGLLYYELTGTIDLGPDGYARSLANDWPDSAALSLVARVSTASESWKWLNRLTLVGAGVVNLKIGRTHYDLYSIQCDVPIAPR